VSYVSKQYLIYDSSSTANFISWGGAVATAIASMGWLQKPDTGQFMWNGMNLTAVSMSGNNATYTYNTLTGPALVVGRALTITGMTNGGNNGTFTITAIAAGTFTVVNASGVNESGSSGVVTAGTVPAAGSWGIEIWGPNDAQQTGSTTYYLKINYGTSTGSPAGPRIQMALGTSTNGSGTLGGYTTSTFDPVYTNYAGGGSITLDCYFSGDINRLGIMLWRQGGMPRQFNVERTHDANGNDTSDGVTIATPIGGASGSPTLAGQQTIMFGVGAALKSATNCFVSPSVGLTTSQLLNGVIPASVIFPCYGLLGKRMLGAVFIAQGDVLSGSIVSLTLYGTTHSYVVGYQTGTMSCPGGNFGCLRYD
jgi:hypothetical protein